MRLYIVRHGKARQESPSGLDGDRALRKRGRRQARWLAQALAQQLPTPGVVVSSGLVRADQTAGPIAEELGVELLIDERLACESSLAQLIQLVAELRGSDAVLVGHNPQLSSLISLLIGSDEWSDGWLRTGQCAVIEVSDPEDSHDSGTLEGFLRLDE